MKYKTKSLASKEHTLQKIQAASGLIFGSYLFLHIPTILSSHFGHEVFDRLLNVFRNYYHNPLLEIIIFICLLLHISCGSYFYFQRRRNKSKNTATVSFSTKVIRTSGEIALFLTIFHFVGVRLESYMGWGEKSEYSHIRASLLYFPSLFVPYYIILSISGLFHFIFGFLKAIQILGYIPFSKYRKISKSKQLWFILILLSFGLISAILSFMRIPGIKWREEYWMEHIKQKFEI